MKPFVYLFNLILQFIAFFKGNKAPVKSNYKFTRPINNGNVYINGVQISNWRGPRSHNSIIKRARLNV